MQTSRHVQGEASAIHDLVKLIPPQAQRGSIGMMLLALQQPREVVQA